MPHFRDGIAKASVALGALWPQPADQQRVQNLTVPFGFNLQGSGGQDQSELLRELAGGAGVPLDLAQAEAAKEALCAVAESSDAFEALQSAAGSAAGAGAAFTLPDGRIVQLPAHALSRCAELPFAPPVGAGIAEEILASMQLCSLEQRKGMLETIVLSGGMKGMTGFEPRLVRELGAAALYARPAAVQPPEYMEADRRAKQCARLLDEIKRRVSK